MYFADVIADSSVCSFRPTCAAFYSFIQAVEVVPVQVAGGKATLGMVEVGEREGREREREEDQLGASHIFEL